MGWIYLTFAILCETIGTTTLKLSNGFTVLLPSIVTVITYGLSFFLLSKSLRTIEVGVMYAIWSAVGTALITLIGIFYFHESVSFVKIFFICLIIAGTIGLKIIS